MAREHSLDRVGERLAAVYDAVTDGESVTPERETLATV
jgi:hypothetical protein